MITGANYLFARTGGGEITQGVGGDIKDGNVLASYATSVIYHITGVSG
jgi:hypothetical protein